ncbi:MAG: hypothetical protein LBS99_02095, partial [Clostridiales bacterium]|nr:hypothetical protein [Clostridiales bacterium]
HSAVYNIDSNIESVIRKITVTVEKAPQDAPNRPKLVKVTTTSIELAVDGILEYSVNGGEWQSSPQFLDLKPGTAYTFVQRLQADANHLPGASGKSVTITTLRESDDLWWVGLLVGAGVIAVGGIIMILVLKKRGA